MIWVFHLPNRSAASVGGLEVTMRQGNSGGEPLGSSYLRIHSHDRITNPSIRGRWHRFLRHKHQQLNILLLYKLSTEPSRLSTRLGILPCQKNPQICIPNRVGRSKRLGYGQLVLILIPLLVLSLRILGYQCLNSINGCIGPTGFSKQDLPLFIHSEDSSHRSLRSLLQSNGANQRGIWIAEEGVREVLLCPKSCVGFGRIGRETIDGQPS